MRFNDFMPEIEKYDKVLLEIIDRNIKQIYIYHARESGAPDDWIKSIATLESGDVCQIVTILYGDPIRVK